VERHRVGLIRGAVWVWAALVVTFVSLGSVAATAADGDTVHFDVMVSRISNEPGTVDARASRLDATLRDEFRYESLAVLQEKRITVAINDLASMKLPNGKELQLRPLSLSDRGVLVAVNVEGAVQSDMQIPNGHLVAIGAGRFEAGKLVISIEASY
jgi:hypothetical protein